MVEKSESARGPKHRSEVWSQDASWHGMSIACNA